MEFGAYSDADDCRPGRSLPEAAKRTKSIVTMLHQGGDTECPVQSDCLEVSGSKRANAASDARWPVPSSYRSFGVSATT
jgi:hypothetical protein